MKPRIAVAATLALTLHALLLFAASPASPAQEAQGYGSAAGDETVSTEEAAAQVSAAVSERPAVRLALRTQAEAAPAANTISRSDAGAGESYLGRVRAVLNGRAAQMSAQLDARGIAVIRFEVLLDGRTAAARLARSSGHAALDAAALALLQQGPPLPRPPEAMQLRVPVQFQ